MQACTANWSIFHMHTHERPPGSSRRPSHHTGRFPGALPAHTHSCSPTQRTGCPVRVYPSLWRTPPCQRGLSCLPPGSPVSILPCPSLTFTAFGSPSYVLVQGYRSAPVLENMKPLFLNLFVPFQVISEKKKELFKTRSP